MFSLPFALLGHIGKDCTNVKEGEPGIDGKPAPVTYVPDVVDDADSLFKRGCNAGINFDKYVICSVLFGCL